MSSGKLKKVANRILDDLAKKANKAEKSSRKDLERQYGQILIINRTRFTNILVAAVSSLKGQPELVQKIWDKFSQNLRNNEAELKRSSPARYKELVNATPSLRRSDHVFYITNYNFIQKEKTKLKDIVQAELDAWNENQKKKDKLVYTQEGLSRLGGSDNKFGAQLGHEEAGLGTAASGVRVARAKQIRDNSGLGRNERAQITRAISRFENTLGLTIKHTQIINSSLGIKKKYVPILSWQKAVDNNTQGKLEQAAVEALEKYLQNIATAESSTSLSDGVAQVLLHTATPKKARVKGKSKKQIKESSKAKSKKKTETKKEETIVRDSGVGKLSIAARRGRGSRSASSPLYLIGILNKQLPEAVAANMESPRLNYRTGRFASSVQVTDIAATAKGFPSIGYIYQKYPYQTFEPGYAQGSAERDPRKLIDRSIRDIAVQFALGRFYTRRV